MNKIQEETYAQMLSEKIDDCIGLNMEEAEQKLKEAILNSLVDEYSYREEVIDLEVVNNGDFQTQIILSINKVAIADVFNGVTAEMDKTITDRYLSVMAMETIDDIKTGGNN